jgi:hypothetical protein
MRLNKIPIPMLLAALVATTAVVVYLQLSVISAPVVADSNFTSTLVAGTPYLWRGAATEITISSNATIKVAYMPVGYVVYINGPLGNSSLGSGKWLIYLEDGRPLLVEKVAYPDGYNAYHVFKLVNASRVGSLTVLVPNAFDLSDTLSDAEYNAMLRNGVGSSVYRVVQVTTNGTHIELRLGDVGRAQINHTTFVRLPNVSEITSTKITSSGYGVSYVVNSTTVSAYLMPYYHIVITPNATARVTITVK